MIILSLHIIPEKDVLAYTSPSRGYYSKAEFYEQFGIGNSAQILKWKKSLPEVGIQRSRYFTRILTITISSVFVGNSLFVASKIEDLGVKWTISSDSASDFSKRPASSLFTTG